jgi:MFS family permease
LNVYWILTCSFEDTTTDPAIEQDSPSEHSPLLSSQRISDHYDGPKTQDPPKATPNFYKCIFSKPNFSAGLWCGFMVGVIFTAFNTTVTLHVRDAFQWGGMQTGLTFAALQAPRLVMAPFVGWLKDRIGTRIPTVYGYAVLTPLFWILGIPGSGLFPWADTESRGPALYVLAMVLIGFNSTFLNAAGAIEATMAAKELAKEHPGAFGPGGGKSRALALSGITFVLGSCAGPVLAGTLNEKFGYYVMNCVIGEPAQL